MSALAKIHVAKKALALDDDTYRDVLGRVTGKRSAKDLTVIECGRVLDEFKRLGFKPMPVRRASGAVEMEGPYGGKLQALWISAWNLGVVRDRSDRALVSFVERQTGIERTRFLRDAKEAAKAIEGLKKWIGRETGVDWPGRTPLPHETKRAVIKAQLAILGRAIDNAAAVDPDAYMAALGVEIRRRQA
ncbi:regulatory protein GemA [Kaistia sp. MMO-174]|uniref:regulatory protein GemA n=1 Tax=Kaistia sp. MMO-174 TaxID=3081256 RepID=UPI00301AB516